MNKCKCVKTPESAVAEVDQKFKINNYYEFDYIPPVKDNASYYRVFSLDEGFSKNFNLKDFQVYFRKY